jgi:hypothetical protein
LPILASLEIAVLPFLMRAVHLAVVVLFGACSGDEQPAKDSTCQLGLRIHREALKAALERAPSCEDDADCVVMREAVACPGSLDINLCDLAVHRQVLDYYDRDAVAQAMCEATEGSELGCSISASCAAHEQPRCQAGECTFLQDSD